MAKEKEEGSRVIKHLIELEKWQKLKQNQKLSLKVIFHPQLTLVFHV